jgi:hypothetical protein
VVVDIVVVVDVIVVVGVVVVVDMVADNVVDMVVVMCQLGPYSI